MNLAERLIAAQAALDAAEKAFTPSDEAEERAFAEIAQVEGKAAELRERLRELDLSRDEAAAKNTLGEDAAIRGVLPLCYPDRFVVRRNGVAHDKWVRALNSKSGKPIDVAGAALDYAMHAIYSWNGYTDLDGPRGPELRQYLQANPGIVTPITEAAAELAGVLAKERKSRA